MVGIAGLGFVKAKNDCGFGQNVLQFRKLLLSKITIVFDVANMRSM